MHTCFSEQSPEATRLGRGRAEGGAGSDHHQLTLTAALRARGDPG